MNIQFITDRAVSVTVTIDFIDGARYRAKFCLRGKERDGLYYNVPGRLPGDIAKLQVAYEGHSFTLVPPFASDDGINLKAMTLYSGKDYWAQVLREEALKSG
jgi:hypothetical protein